jgi:hypothetical protein
MTDGSSSRRNAPANQGSLSVSGMSVASPAAMDHSPFHGRPVQGHGGGLAPLLPAVGSEGTWLSLLASAAATSGRDEAGALRDAYLDARRGLVGSVEPGDLVVETGPATHTTVLRALAVQDLGATSAHLPHTLSETERTHRLRSLGGAAPWRPCAVAGADMLRAPSRLSAGGHLVLFTSGTSGNGARAVVLTSTAVRANARMNANVFGVTELDTTVVLLPLSHGYALVHQFLTHAISGAGVRVLSLATPDWPARLGAVLGVVPQPNIALVPALARRLVADATLRHRIRRCRYVTVGAAPWPAAELTAFARQVHPANVAYTYGLTEAGPRVATRFVDPDVPGMDGDVGEPLPGVQVEVGETGTLVVRSPSMALGYLEQGVLQRYPSELDTRDLGEVHAGAVIVHGRRDELKTPRGEIVARARIKAVLDEALGDRAPTVKLDRRGLGFVAQLKRSADVSAADLRRALRTAGLHGLPFQIISEGDAQATWKTTRFWEESR